MSHYEIDHPMASVELAIDELLLIENHCSRRFCGECVRKHARTCLALAREAVSLSGGVGPYAAFAQAVENVTELANGYLDPDQIGAAARHVRRQYLRKGFPG